MSTIKDIRGLEILDSRGRPTVKATVFLESGIAAQASVPSGASTGGAEAVELRDGDPERYRGLGCRKAVANLEGEMRRELTGARFDHPFELDQRLIALDGTPDKHRLGANAILAVSLAFARAQARDSRQPLYQFFAGMIGRRPAGMPRLTVNLFSGGLHAGGIVPVQDCLVVPGPASTVDDALAMTYDVYQEAARLMRKKFGMRLLTADEGGLSPGFNAAEDMFELAVEAIRSAGLRPGRDMALAIDVAASHFFRNGKYYINGEALDSKAMAGLLESWTERYPIVSIEDGLAEEDWEFWPLLNQRLGEKLLIMGDDLLCTNVARIHQAAKAGAANALLLKINQVGTLYEASLALQTAREHGWSVTISARSGETEDDWLADLAVGWGGDYIKIGSINQSERLAKYNRLLEIEKEKLETD
jgi:enolase